MAFSAWKNLCLIALKFGLQGIVAFLNVLGKMVLALVLDNFRYRTIQCGRKTSDLKFLKPLQIILIQEIPLNPRKSSKLNILKFREIPSKQIKNFSDFSLNENQEMKLTENQ